MMSLTQPETQALGSIADGLAGADPRLASMLTIFSRLAAGEDMPAREKTRARCRRLTARRRRGPAPRRGGGGGGPPPAAAPPPGGTRAGAQPARTRAAGPRASIGRPCWCWGRSSPPHCSPSRWPSPPAAPRPASSR